MSDEQKTVDEAIRIIRQDYYDDVRGVAEDVMEEMKVQHKDGVTGEDLREWLIEYMHETIDGTQRVIYTFQAQLGLISSDNAGAYIEDFGAEGAVEGGDICWSRLMFCAMERDVYEQLEANGVDVNDPESFFTEEDDDEE